MCSQQCHESYHEQLAWEVAGWSFPSLFLSLCSSCFLPDDVSRDGGPRTRLRMIEASIPLRTLHTWYNYYRGNLVPVSRMVVACNRLGPENWFSLFPFHNRTMGKLWHLHRVIDWPHFDINTETHATCVNIWKKKFQIHASCATYSMLFQAVEKYPSLLPSNTPISETTFIFALWRWSRTFETPHMRSSGARKEEVALISVDADMGLRFTGLRLVNGVAPREITVTLIISFYLCLSRVYA